MRRLLTAAVFLVALTVVPMAVASVVHAEGSSIAGGVKFTWVGDYDTATNTLTFTCTQTDADTGQPVAAEPGETGGVTITLTNGQTRTFDCFQMGIVNAGTQVFDHTNLKVDTVGRWSGFTLNDYFTPPSG